MKKFALCMLVLALAVAVVPQSQASQCVHFTNFCDTINVNIANVGGNQGKIIYGAWDWVCLGDWTTSSVWGKVEGTAPISTRPVYAGVPFSYTAGFTFKQSGHTFDLYGTTYNAQFAFQLASPWTLSNGACPARPNKNLPSLLGR